MKPASTAAIQSAAGIAGCGCVMMAGIPLVVVVMIATILSNPLTLLRVCAPNDTSGSGGSGAVQARAEGGNPGSIPSNYYKLYKKAASEWNLPWTALAAIGWVETRHGTAKDANGNPAQGVLSGQNFAGAGGPMQFLQSTFDVAKVDGDGDGEFSRYQPADAIYSAAKLLKLHIMPGVGEKALKARILTQQELAYSIHRYNPTEDHSYQRNVLSVKAAYDKKYDVMEPNYASSDCSSFSGLSFGSRSFGERIAYAAALSAIREPGKPEPPRTKEQDKSFKAIDYSWGGGSWNGPDHGICCSPGGQDGRKFWGFDCSGFVVHTVYQASGKKIKLPRTTQRMVRSNLGVRVPRDQLIPGDLLFFGVGEATHVAVFYGNFRGRLWMVEALRPGTKVMFSEFGGRRNFITGYRVKPPPGLADAPGQYRAMPSGAADIGAGAM
ncbi:NlpC/P60 family protein [Actinomadura adrarensis]|uniref:NlpC/P60 family protein n=1 Tax=Actinomadura adrarensis TaxID=1819600 RepID=A0ABW3CRH2_9ACTN